MKRYRAELVASVLVLSVVGCSSSEQPVNAPASGGAADDATSGGGSSASGGSSSGAGGTTSTGCRPTTMRTLRIRWDLPFMDLAAPTNTVRTAIALAFNQ